jgi:hypothetical protein
MSSVSMRARMAMWPIYGSVPKAAFRPPKSTHSLLAYPLRIKKQPGSPKTIMKFLLKKRNFMARLRAFDEK